MGEYFSSLLRAAVLWCAIEFGVGVRYSADTGAVTIFDEPIAIPDVEPMAHIGKITKWKSTEGCYEAGWHLCDLITSV